MGAITFCNFQFRLDGRYDHLGDVILELKYVFQNSIIALRPYVRTRSSLYKLGCYSNSGITLANRSFQDVMSIQFSPNFGRMLRKPCLLPPPTFDSSLTLR